MVRKVINLVLILILILAFLNLSRQISTALQSEKRLDQSADRLAQLESEHQKLNQQLSGVENQDYIEKVARDELDYSKPNETVVIIPQDQIDRVLSAQRKTQEPVLPNWQAWLKLIFH